MNIFKTITVQKNPIVLTGCKRFSDITFLSSQISTFGMVIVCTGTYHRLRSVEIYVGLSFQCSAESLRSILCRRALSGVRCSRMHVYSLPTANPGLCSRMRMHYTLSTAVFLGKKRAAVFKKCPAVSGGVIVRRRSTRGQAHCASACTVCARRGENERR